MGLLISLKTNLGGLSLLLVLIEYLELKIGIRLKKYRNLRICLHQMVK